MPRIAKHIGREEQAPSGAEQTRQALVHAALRLFGTVGYDGASTREIAAAANANIGSIAYHFGGKEGLRLAVADHIVGVMQSLATRAAAESPPMPAASPELAEAQLQKMLERMFAFFVASPEAGEIVPFVLREMSAPTDAFDRIYTGVFEPMHRRFCGVWEIATGEPAESEETKISVFTLIGQVVYFRLAREAIRRRMGWREIGPKEVSAVAAVAGRNLKAAIDAHKRDRS
ncbi:MAG: CerR family C-terminal domain-containing protein [Rhizobiaceae bacterium]